MTSGLLQSRVRFAMANRAAGDELLALLQPATPYSRHWYVDAQYGSDNNEGDAADKAFATMGAAFNVIGDNAVIHLRGPITETITCPDGVTGVTVIGDGSGLRHGSTSNVAEGYAPAWHDDAEAPLVQVHSQGWTFANILFAPHAGDCAIEILSDGAADPEHTVSGLRILNCRFQGGEHAIKDVGGSGYVTVAGCHFDTHTVAAIANTSTANALPLEWRIFDNDFVWSAVHIDMPLSKSFIYNNRIGLVASTGLYIDLTGGANNMVCGNYLAGVYTTADYVAGTSDLWLGNFVTVVSTQAPNGFTILAAAAP